MLERKSFAVNNIIGGRSEECKHKKGGLPAIISFRKCQTPIETKNGGESKKKNKSDRASEGGTLHGIKNLLNSTDLVDKCLMTVGFLFAVFNGAMMPAMAIVFGQMTDKLLMTDRSVHNLTADSPKAGDQFNFTSTYNETSSMVDEVSVHFANGITRYTNLYLVIAAVSFVCSFVQIYCWETASERLIYRLRRTYFAQILRLDVEWFDQNEDGDLASKLTDDFERMRNGLGSKVPMITQFISQFITGVIVGYFASWKLSLVLCFAGPVIIASSALAATAMTGAALREQLRYGIASGIASEVLTSIKTVVAFGKEDQEVKRYDQAMEDGRLQTLSKYYSMATAMALSFGLMYSVYALGLWYGSTLFLKNEIAPGDIFTVFFSLLVAAFSIGHSLPIVGQITNAVGASSVVFTIINQTPKIDIHSDKGLKPNNLEGNIVFKDVKFTYPARPDVEVLKGLNLTIKSGSVVALVGQSGAGKSTLVGLAMRFYDPTSGEIKIDGRNLRDLNLNWLRKQIGVVSQEPVLFGVSIADNIRYGNGDATQEEIIAAAKLANAHEFITNFPNGYDTQVGDLGTMMSGGQKQRIAIARAIVRDPKILLLDEATSALDSMSETVVQKALNRAMKGRTTVIIAHRLSTVRDVDVIYAMKDGLITEFGTHAELMAKKEFYYSLVMSQSKKSEDKEPLPEMSFTDINLQAWKRSASLRRSRRSSTKSVKSIREDEDETPETPVVSFLDIFKLSTAQWPLLVTAMLCCAINGFNTPLFSIIYSEIIQLFLLPVDEIQRVVPFWCEMFFALAAVMSVTYFIAVMSSSMATEKLIQLLRTLTFKNIISQQICFFDDDHYTPLKLTNTLAKDPPLIKDVAGMRAGIILLNGITLVAAVGITFYSSWKLALVASSIIPVLTLIAWKQCDLKFRQYTKEVECMEEASKMASECVQNVRTVRMLGLEKFMTETYSESLLEVSSEVKKQGKYFSVAYALTQCSLFLVYALAYQYGAKLLDDHEIQVKDIYRIVFALGFSFPSLGYGCIFLQDFVKSKPSISYIFKLLKLKSSLDTFSEEGLKPDIKGKVTFKNIEFSYPSRKHIPILKGLDLNIEPGQTVALVGGSGSGKSTIISLLERYYSPDKGQITVDDADIASINLKHLRSAMGIVTQEPYLFDCSIKDNIAYGSVGQVTDQQIIQAATKANIHDFITRLPQGYETPAGDRGLQLSGGQKQRIAIARALIRDPKILLLDEATSALDNESEKIVQEALDKAREGRTSIIVAHRLSTIRDADTIAVIKNRRVVEKGTHQQLKNMQGHYYNLIRKQEDQEEDDK